MVDAVSLPGKTNQSGEGDDVSANIHAALSELVASSNQLVGREDMTRDLKWQNKDRQALKTIKTEAQLVESLRDVLDIRDRTLRNVTTRQKALLNQEPWNPLLIEAWSSGGFVYVISQRSIEHYVSFLQHLLLINGAYGWDEVQRLIDHHINKWALMRSNSTSRLQAICQIYALLRDGADAKWVSPSVEAKKLTSLFTRVMALEAGGTRGAVGASGSPRFPICDRCGTILHGTNPCPFSLGSPASAKKKGQQMLRKLAADGAELGEG
jgi:hypothetical protein